MFGNPYKFYRVPSRAVQQLKPSDEMQFYRVGQELQSTAQPMSVSQMMILAACFSVLLIFAI